MKQRRGVILAAHGAGDGSLANRRVLDLANAVRRARPELEVIPAFQLGSPQFRESIDLLTSAHATVVPLMTSEGYFFRERLPAELHRSIRHAEVRITITPPIGAMQRLREGMISRVEELVNTMTTDVCVIVVGHGTRRSATSGNATRDMAFRMAEVLPKVQVLAAFLDEPPLLEEIIGAVTAGTIVIAPFLVGGGNHAGDDIANRISGATRARSHLKALDQQVLIAPTLGDQQDLVNTVLDLADWHAPDRVYRLGTRRSALAIRQADIAACSLLAAGFRTELVLISTDGDRDQQRQIDAFETDGPFTDTIEAALADGSIDLAVHSLKDLPLRHAGATVISAVLARGPVGEALVARRGCSLADLPAGARVGTSSKRRAAQLALVRPDVRSLPIRGPVDERLARVGDGEFDAAILAEAGLLRLGAADRVTARLPLEQFVPDPGQGAIVVTARADDAPARAAAASIDDPATRRAVTAERDAARLIESNDVWFAAAYAEPSATLRLRVRAIHRATGEIRDTVVHAAEPIDAARQAVAQLALPQEAFR
jgi:hydroxymethylbilane synthase